MRIAPSIPARDPLEPPSYDSRGSAPREPIPDPASYPYETVPRSSDPLSTHWGFGCFENQFNGPIAQAVSDRWSDPARPLPSLLFKSLIAAESAFNPLALSPSGAAGLVQLMPGTAQAFGLSLYPVDERLVPEKALPVGVAVLNEKYRVLTDPSPANEWGRLVREAYEEYGPPDGEPLWKLVLAGYNGGASTVLRAMAQAYSQGLDPRDWDNLVGTQGPLEESPLFRAVESVYGAEQALRKYREMAAYPGRVLVYYQRATHPLQGRRIVVDPGHGGKDPGAIGPAGTREKAVNLAISLKLRDSLQNLGAEVRMTRDTDRSVAPPGSSKREELQARVDVANLWPADLFVSVHSNSWTNPSQHGNEVYHARQASRRSQDLARHVHREMVDRLGIQGNGVRRADFYVIKNTDMPAVLVETAYISNPTEEALLADPQFQTRAAEAVAAGVVELERQPQQQFLLRA